MFIPGKPRDIATEHDNMAEDWAKHLAKPFDPSGRDVGLLIALWRMDVVNPELLDAIECQPQEFSERVSCHLMLLEYGNDE